MKKSKGILGIDIGGTGIKLGITDVTTGKLLTKRYKYLTPKPSTPEAVAQVIHTAMEEQFSDYKGIIGVGFPAIIKKGKAWSATNVDKSWYKKNIAKYFKKEFNTDIYVANDADVAGFAEINFGKSKVDKDGLIIFLTVGTGIGSAIFYEGQMIPNTELGHMLYKGDIYERYVSNVARKKADLSWSEWGERFNGYLEHLDRLFSPDTVIIGGGISKKFSKYEDEIKVDYQVIPATLKNEAGVVGASVYAYSRSKKK
ncbi:ROK family protein [Membranicola marinus]|uniref:ROK family protein n=1 Tax=Membranihabitans marinus TaxID=1227546 RepID=A0A953LCE8_9BACT|nr:ROK family protein [Membranihabitans marinus]MBY5959441.1 ROK family protein [Membranihabitans marinus]